MKKAFIAVLLIAAAPAAAYAGSGQTTCYTTFPGLGWLGHMFQIQCQGTHGLSK